jgi:hypothetical protein
MQSRKIAVVDVKPGMQVKYNGGWWQIVSVLHNGLTPTTYGVRAKHVRNDGFASKAAQIPGPVQLAVADRPRASCAQGGPHRGGSAGGRRGNRPA